VRVLDNPDDRSGAITRSRDPDPVTDIADGLVDDRARVRETL